MPPPTRNTIPAPARCPPNSFAPGEAREDWAIIRALSDYLNKRLAYDSLQQLRRTIFSAYPHLGRIDKPNVLASTLNNIPGVVEHGLFIGLATGAILATGEGLVELGQV